MPLQQKKVAVFSFASKKNPSDEMRCWREARAGKTDLIGKAAGVLPFTKCVNEAKEARRGSQR